MDRQKPRWTAAGRSDGALLPIGSDRVAAPGRLDEETPARSSSSSICALLSPSKQHIVPTMVWESSISTSVPRYDTSAPLARISSMVSPQAATAPSSSSALSPSGTTGRRRIQSFG